MNNIGHFIHCWMIFLHLFSCLLFYSTGRCTFHSSVLNHLPAPSDCMLLHFNAFQVWWFQIFTVFVQPALHLYITLFCTVSILGLTIYLIRHCRHYVTFVEVNLGQYKMSVEWFFKGLFYETVNTLSIYNTRWCVLLWDMPFEQCFKVYSGSTPVHRAHESK